MYILAVWGIVGSVLPLHRSKHWFVRGQANFRAFYLVYDVLLMVALVSISGTLWAKSILFVMLLYGAVLCWRSIAPYTPIGSVSIADVKGPGAESISILIHNVYQYNTKYANLIEMVQKENADVVLLLETSIDWDKPLSPLYSEYEYVVKEIREDTYGIVMMSKLPVLEGGINHLVSKNIPSAEMLIMIVGIPVRILGIHPEPPIMTEVETSVPKEKEILYAARYLNMLPTDEYHILIGDLNDVAWSRVSTTIKEITGMGDPREGRGFYSTFPTYLPIRIPLDHVFCSTDFTLAKFQRMPHIGSDHYPVSVTLALPDTAH